MEEIIQKLPGALKNEPMAAHTTFKIGGPAKYFYVAQNSQELLTAVKAAEESSFPYCVIGWGSNLLVADSGYNGLIIKTMSDKIEVRGDEIWAEAGLSLGRLVGLAAQAGLSGLETLAGIPGTVGGACFGNAGAYGISIGKLVKEVEVYQDGEIKKMNREEMTYDYRQSALKKKNGIILSVLFKLEKKPVKEIHDQVVKLVISRKQGLPAEPSAGSIFKNIKLNKVAVDKQRIKKVLELTEEEWLNLTKRDKISAAFIIDRLNLKGKTIGGCQISPKHANFFVNIGNAKAEHVVMMISDVKMRVRNELGIQLEEEIRYLGFD